MSSDWERSRMIQRTRTPLFLVRAFHVPFLRQMSIQTMLELPSDTLLLYYTKLLYVLS